MLGYGIKYRKFTFNPPEPIEEDFNALKLKLHEDEKFRLEKYFFDKTSYWLDILCNVTTIALFVYFSYLLEGSETLAGLFLFAAALIFIGSLFEFYYLSIYTIRKKTYYSSLKKEIIKSKNYDDFIRQLRNNFENKNLDLIERQYRLLSDTELIALMNNSNGITPDAKNALTKIYSERNLYTKNLEPTFGGLTIQQIDLLDDEEYNAHLSKLSESELSLYHSKLME